MENVFYFKQNIRKMSDEDSKVLHLIFKHGAKLYNEALYYINKNHEKTGKFTVWTQVNDYLSHTKQTGICSNNYCLLGDKLSLSIIRNLDINFKNFFSNNSKGNEGNLERPNYRNNNYFISVFPSMITKKDGKIRISITKAMKEKYSISSNYFLEFKIPKRMKDIDFSQVRIHQDLNNHYYLVYHYKKEIKDLKQDNGRYLGIDFGVENLMACYPYADDKTLKPFIIKGRKLKYINHQELLKIKINLERNGKKTTEKVKKIYLKRRNRLDFEMDRYVRYIGKYCEITGINTIVVGFFKDIKVKMVARTFYYIPYSKLRRKLRDMAKKLGLNINFINESYTSKTSFYDYEPAKKIDFSGRRVERGLFKTNKKRLINADINGAAQIITKCIKKELKNRKNVLIGPRIMK